MNPAEEIVKFWLQHNNYFVQSSIRVPSGYNREIDILATNEQTGEKKHIEVSVSVKMQAINYTLETLAEHFVQKFDNERVASEVRRRFADSVYTKELVVGEVRLKGKDQLAEFTAECAKHGIVVVPISQILADVMPTLQGQIILNPIIKTLQLAKKFL